MLPYIRIPDVPVGPLTLHPFGMLVATAVMVGYFIARRRARALGLDDLTLTSTLNWMLVGAFVFAHVFDVLTYHPEDLRRDPWVLFKLWASLSSFGGFIGATAGAMIALWRRRVPMLPYLDTIAFALAPAWAIGRMGCAVAHDHPGRLSTCWLAVRPGPMWPDGSRFDLGLLEVPVALFLAGVLLLLSRRERGPGTYVGVLALLYGVARFGLDFLRATDLSWTDPRYLGFTPAQYGCFALVVVGAILLWRAARRPAATAAMIDRDGTPGEA